MTEPVTTGQTDDQEVGTPDNMEERNPSPKAVSRKEKRKALKKDKRKQIRKELAEKARTEEEARLNDPEVKRKIELEEEREKERLEKERKEFEERERIFLEELQKKKEEEEEEERRNAVESESKPKQEGTEEVSNEDDDEWEYIEEGPPEIIWQGNEIIVKKNKVKVKKKEANQSIQKEDPDRPTSNPLPPQSEAYAAFKNAPMTPTELLDTVAQQVPNFGTEQDKAHCPFHIKTGACRFGMRCNRVHYYPDKSTTLLIKNMYNGPGLAWEQDEGLEYTEEEVGRSYEEFYEDVHTEFLKFGEIINFKVCRNGSFHLRGNVYIQYKSLDSAVMAYNSVHGRYFASKQVKCEFVSLTRWKVAICGEYMKSRLKTCSRGSACNFLHCFTNPGGDYEWADCDKPPPRFWVTKMVALFGYSEDDTWHQPTPRDQHRIFTSDRVSYREKRHRSIEKNQHNGNSSRKHHDENHVRKSRKHERDKNYEHENSDSDGDRLRRHHEGSQTHSRHSRSKESNYRKSKRRTHGSSSSSSSCDEDFYTKKRHLNTKSRSRRAKNVSESSNDEESDDAELKRRKERKTNCQRSRRRGRDGGSCEIDGESGKVERRRNGRSRSREGGGGCLSEKIEMGDRWEPEGSPDELKNSEGDGKSSHGENRRSLDCDDKMRDKRKRI
ncbi:zinc finger CCCH domain-containing protein 5 [Lactuca sativa]|uniref:Zinc finger CCCH domain-containing protein 5 n=1 Tax=Lactuca sativa TaxID=4236 RepID=A0A9R1UH07_LACSA|nr:zinc finger CCCH domain-containing protein 5 [Lactuca sativa]KAJ0187192.1 hypothetical protein LSAT_V11C900505220 [Lactuca sativa]